MSRPQPGRPDTRSPAELALRDQQRAGRLTGYVFNVRVPGFAYITPDLSHPAARVAVEVDGYAHHDADRRQAQRDRARDRQLVDVGWSVRRYTAAEVLADPGRVADDLDAAAARRLGEHDRAADLLAAALGAVPVPAEQIPATPPRCRRCGEPGVRWLDLPDNPGPWCLACRPRRVVDVSRPWATYRCRHGCAGVAAYYLTPAGGRIGPYCRDHAPAPVRWPRKDTT